MNGLWTGKYCRWFVTFVCSAVHCVDTAADCLSHFSGRKVQWPCAWSYRAIGLTTCDAI